MATKQQTAPVALAGPDGLACHQPGVEAGKKAAAAVLALQGQIAAALSATR